MHQEMLEQLDKELEDLQTQLANKENDLNLTEVEIERDQNAIEFLNHTIATTKRNQRLLIKRQNLLKTRHSLEKVIHKILDIKFYNFKSKTIKIECYWDLEYYATEVYSSIAIRVVDWQSTMYFGNPNSFSPPLPTIPNPPIHS